MSWTKHSSQGDGVVWMAGLVSNSNPVDKGKRSYSKSDMGKHDGQAESIATIVYFRVYKKKKSTSRFCTMAIDWWVMKTHLQSCFGDSSGAKSSANYQIKQCQDVPRKWPFENVSDTDLLSDTKLRQGKAGCRRRKGHCFSLAVLQWEKQSRDRATIIELFSGDRCSNCVISSNATSLHDHWYYSHF